MAPCLRIIAAVICLYFSTTLSINNGLGISPPLGWRSWNAYGTILSQALMINVTNMMLDTSRSVNGKPMSLVEIGYNRIGIDAGWFMCDHNSSYSSNGLYWHNESAPNGWPMIRNSTFPNITQMIEYIHGNKMLIGWYMNCCGHCPEQNGYPANEYNDVLFLRQYDFDGIKLDSCGSSTNISNWQHLINITGSKPLLTENCHNQPNDATLDWCPMNFFRSSSDINTNYPHVIGNNLQSVVTYTSKYPTGFISRPGCFAYPDMLEVGNFGYQYKATPQAMDQTHFSAWSVVSSPLILGFDLTNSTKMNQVWDVITNLEVLNVSQNWAGHPGRQIKVANYSIFYNDLNQYEDHYGMLSSKTVTLYEYEIWAKPQPGNTFAVLLMNNDGNYSHDIIVNFDDIPWNGTANIRDIVNHKDLGKFTNQYTAKTVEPFGSVFLLFSQ